MTEETKSDGKKPKNRFLRVKCPGCGNEQAIFSAPSRDVKCLACNQVLGESTGHKINLKGTVVKEF